MGEILSLSRSPPRREKTPQETSDHSVETLNNKMGKGQNEGGFSEEQLQMNRECFKLMDNNKMGKGQNEGGFSEEQLQMYRECFKLMDINKDGTIDKNDLRGAFDNVGVLMTEGELDELLG